MLISEDGGLFELEANGKYMWNKAEWKRQATDNPVQIQPVPWDISLSRSSLLTTNRRSRTKKNGAVGRKGC